MGESIFVSGGDDARFDPTGHARGPWDPRALHGGAPAALIARAFERVQPGGELPIARLSFDFLRPIPMAALELTTRITRPGRRVQELEAELHAEGVLVCRARALRILPAPEKLPDAARGHVGERDGEPLPAPEQGRQVRFALDDLERLSFAASAMEMRFLRGGPPLGGLPESGVTAGASTLGPATVWMRLRHPLLPDEPPTPLARLAATADFGNGVSAVLPFEDYLFINADLTIALDRRPEGEWIALESRSFLSPAGIGWAESVVHDERGPVALARQALVVQRR